MAQPDSTADLDLAQRRGALRASAQMRMIQMMLTAAPTMPVTVTTMKRRSTQSTIA